MTVRHGHIQTSGDIHSEIRTRINSELVEHAHEDGAAFHEHLELFDHYPVCGSCEHTGAAPLARYWCNVARVMACGPCDHGDAIEWPELARWGVLR